MVKMIRLMLCVSYHSFNEVSVLIPIQALGREEPFVELGHLEWF